jgi:Ca-activated chloride channel homolog
MNTIHSTFLSENQYWLSGAPKQEFHLYLELQGAEAPVAAGRVPLNLSLVIDRSGSMAGDKIAFAKKAAQFVVDNLRTEDRVSSTTKPGSRLPR